MDGQPTSSDTELLSLLRSGGRSPTELRDLISKLHQDNLLTEEAYLRLLASMQQRSGSRSSSLRTISTIEETMTRQPSSEARTDLDARAVNDVPRPASMLSPTEAAKYRLLHNQAFNLPTSLHPTSQKHPAPSESRIRRWRSRLTRVPPVLESARSLSSNMFLMPIRVEARRRTRSAILLLDTGSDFNIMGLQVAKLLRPDLDTSRAEKLANTAGGSLETLGSMPARWWCENERFPKRFETTVFHISAGTLDVDAIIGWRDIVRLDLVRLNAQSFVGFTNLPSRVNRATARREQAAADARRAAEENEMRLDNLRRNYEQKRLSYAREHALRHAWAYAAQYEQLNGQEGLEQAYDARYEEVFRQLYDDYPRHTPPQ